MSLSLGLQIDTGGPEPALVWDGWNYTHNVNPMYYPVLGESLGLFLEGKTAAESLPKLRELVADLEDRPAFYRAMDPENGWGCYETLLPRLRVLVQRAAENPKCRWWVSR